MLQYFRLVKKMESDVYVSPRSTHLMVGLHIFLQNLQWITSCRMLRMADLDAPSSFISFFILSRPLYDITYFSATTFDYTVFIEPMLIFLL
jgi:hypothetical protein